MIFFKKWMFIPMPTIKKNEMEYIENHKDLEEIPPKIPPSSKEKLIVHFVFFLMGMSAISLITYFVMLIFTIQDEGKVLNVFFFTMSPLIGYLLGANKERGPKDKTKAA